MIRFEADSAKINDFCVVVPGRVHQGTIRVGSVFTAIEMTSATSATIKLRVEKIVAYGHSLEELPEGMTGELQLTGEGREDLLQIECPFICIGME
jgi:hypothetical protein